MTTPERIRYWLRWPPILGCVLLAAWAVSLPHAVTVSLPDSADSGHILQSFAGVYCLPLPPPTGGTVTVSSVPQLEMAVSSASPGSTILISDGIYDLDGVYLRFETPNVTLRSVSGNRESVVLDGNYLTTEIIQIVASGVTIADLTLREAYYHPIHVMSSEASDTTGTLIYNVHIVDPGEQAIKINPYTEENADYFADGGVIACSHIELTDAGRSQVRNDCYTGGVDAHQSRDWIIRDNLIEGFWCASGLSEHGVHLWRASRDTVVERNDLRNNARGIGFGLVASGASLRSYPDDPCPSAGGEYVDHYGGVIRNNFVFANRSELFASEYGFDCGICLSQTCGAQAVHNSVVSTQAPFSSIEWYLPLTNVTIKNNLVSHNLRDRGGTAVLEGNLSGASLSLFVDGSGGDLHLDGGADAAIDQAVVLPAGLCDDDFDVDSRPVGSAPDIGADEYGVAPPAAVSDLRVSDAYTLAGTLTATLRWTPPVGAITTTVRYADTPIGEVTWAGAAPVTGTLPGDTGVLTAVIPYGGGTAYFALRSWNEGGASALSNNGFWPMRRVYLPAVRLD